MMGGCGGPGPRSARGVASHEQRVGDGQALAARVDDHRIQIQRLDLVPVLACEPREGQHQRLDSLLELSAALQSVAHKTPAHAEAVNAFIEKREPKFGDV